MPEVRRSSRLPRPGEIEARQSALDNLRSKLAPEKARMLHMMAELGLDPKTRADKVEGPIELQRWTYTAVKAYQMAMAIQALKLAEEKVASVVKAEAPRGARSSVADGCKVAVNTSAMMTPTAHAIRHRNGAAATELSATRQVVQKPRG
ncbi:hypothetical protein CVIRNUC_006162 [Coccomyxa viridis]|uniref:Uncharacterized protein n=1 Tax=Coccomyxa viridis TaxID=1274662 RepID=A0AAV1I9S8_9CHLO|nr:hypothetical protein CVIRNUC_006162 [Coccomyxa viridis]